MNSSSFIAIALAAGAIIRSADMPSQAAPAPTAAQAKVHGWQIQQKGDLYGESIVSFTGDRLRIDLPRNNIVVVAKGPKWIGFAYNQPDRRYCQLDTKNLQPPVQKLLTTFTGQILSIAPVKPLKTGVENGLPAVFLTTSEAYRQQQVLASKARQLSTAGPRKVNLIVLKNNLLPPGASAIVSKIYGIPVGPGVPLRCWYEDIDGDLHKMIRTMSVDPKAQFALEQFELPSGFKKVIDVQHLHEDASLYSEMSEFLDQGTSPKK